MSKQIKLPLSGVWNIELNFQVDVWKGPWIFYTSTGNLYAEFGGNQTDGNGDFYIGGYLAWRVNQQSVNINKNNKNQQTFRPT